ncbi:hypothetical protein MMC13_008493 [Lambiella insularis]|nr:hypothetical protein [Lambiella insularis]
MASSPTITAPRVLHFPGSRAILQAPQLSALMLRSSATKTCSRFPMITLPSASRCFWWGRNGYRSKALSSTATYHKSLEGQQRTAKCKVGYTPLPPLRSGYPFYYCRGQGWRLASSWGKPDGDAAESPSNDSNAGVGKEKETKSEAERWQEELNTHLERLRKRIERYPYETIFGSSIRNGVWNPWESHWHTWVQGLATEECTGQTMGGKTQTLDGSGFGNSTTEAQKNKRPIQADQPMVVTEPASNTSRENLDIDLITLRRVQRRTPPSAEPSRRPNHNDPVKIPVKTFKVSSPPVYSTAKLSIQNATSPNSATTDAAKVKENIRTETPPKSCTKSEASGDKAWLAKEGFSQDQRTREERHKLLNKTSVSGAFKTKKEESPRIETSLERKLREGDWSHLGSNVPRLSLNYKVKDNKTEDIDLLRASDVRASSGHLKKSVSELAEDQEERRTTLKAKFEAKQKDLETQYAAEVAAIANAESKTHKALDPKKNCSSAKIQAQTQNHETGGVNMVLNKISSEERVPANVDEWGYDLAPKGLETSYQDELDNKIQSLEHYYAQQQQELREAELQKKHRLRNATDALLATEIQNQKAAMAALVDRKSTGKEIIQQAIAQESGEGDMSSNVHEFAGRDRWYKRKAPHSLEQDRKKERDATFVRELKQIYEERYGVIDAKHIQPRSDPLMEGKEDPAVQEGLREYDEKEAAETNILPTKGKLAATDLDSYEISLLSNTFKSLNPTSAPAILSSQEQARAATTLPKLPTELTNDTKPAVVNVPKTNTYKVLALDESTQEVTIATTTSSLYESSSPPRSVPAILSHLKQPARYFDHFEPLEAAGYELVAGSRNTLVFKKVREGDPAPTKTMQDTINKFLRTDSSRQEEYLSDIDTSTSCQPKLPSESPDKIQETLNKLKANTSTSKGPLSSADCASCKVDERDASEKAATDPHEIINQTSKAPGQRAVYDPPSRVGIDAIRNLKPKTAHTSCLNENTSENTTALGKPLPRTTINPIDGTTAGPKPLPEPTPTPQLPSQAPSTESPTKEPSPTPPSRHVVHREEDVFTGRQLSREQYREQRRQQRLAAQAERYQKSKEEKRRATRKVLKTAKRIFLTGTWVAACFYLVGALWEEVYRPEERRKRNKLD